MYRDEPGDDWDGREPETDVICATCSRMVTVSLDEAMRGEPVQCDVCLRESVPLPEAA